MGDQPSGENGDDRAQDQSRNTKPDNDVHAGLNPLYWAEFI